ncbi:MAG: restriction endonuclease subunit R, partial [Nitrosospira sp.]|nr:restriction endonuclease subunit R [Nitrosospira sp.]
WQKNELKKTWGTLRRVLSSRSRKARVVEDIVFDFSVKPRLSSERGNAMLVARSILDACEYYALFQKTPLKNRCAVITSYDPHAGDVSKEETGANTETDRQIIYNCYTSLLKHVQTCPGKSKTETYEDGAKKQFIEEPAHMRLLIVVDKLLTGFDAPPCTYLYIDKSMQDHGLFQAICRTNRLDDEDKTFGYIVDYKDLFQKLVNDKGTGALQVYASELDDSAAGVDPNVLVQDRLEKGRERLDAALERFAALCDPVPPPRGELEHMHYFCGNTELPGDLKAREPRRIELYKAVAELLRAWANLADDLLDAGYLPADRERIQHKTGWAVKLRETIRNASGETLDLKPYEADMRHLIDTYVEASAPRKISPFEDQGLLELITAVGMDAAVAQLPDGIKRNKNAVAETIENNVRSKIVKEQLNDPEFYEKMSALLDEVIRFRKEQAERYEEYLQRMAELVAQVQAGHADDTPEVLKKNPAMRALFNNLNASSGANAPARNVADAPTDAAKLELAQRIDAKIQYVRPADWRGNQAKENTIKQALLPLLGNDVEEVERIFRIIMRQSEY